MDDTHIKAGFASSVASNAILTGLKMVLTAADTTPGYALSSGL